MSRAYRFRVVNVFAQSRLSGNPLAVVEDATGLSDEEMQQLALQFNLSESTFIFTVGAERERATSTGANDSSRVVADARVRIFTPTFEMPFAGHPTLGTAHVLRALGHGCNALNLQLNVGVIPVSAQGDVWTLTANAPTFRAYEHSRAQIAEALGLEESDIADAPLWVNAGVEQLIVPVASIAAVAKVAPEPGLFVERCSNPREAQAYVFARDSASRLISRFFWRQHGTILEDPGTGSACANLGGYLLHIGASLPLSIDVHQGAATGRPCALYLSIDSERRIRVGGRVIEMMRGELMLD